MVGQGQSGFCHGKLPKVVVKLQICFASLDGIHCHHTWHSSGRKGTISAKVGGRLVWTISFRCDVCISLVGGSPLLCLCKLFWNICEVTRLSACRLRRDWMGRSSCGPSCDTPSHVRPGTGRLPVATCLYVVCLCASERLHGEHKATQPWLNVSAGQVLTWIRDAFLHSRCVPIIA